MAGPPSLTTCYTHHEPEVGMIRKTVVDFTQKHEGTTIWRQQGAAPFHRERRIGEGWAFPSTCIGDCMFLSGVGVLFYSSSHLFLSQAGGGFSFLFFFAWHPWLCA
ncbi:hypothetical protein LZ30DRAFT_46994 [Colletotrichum cereale]|nr:hypothetical protein LZ30DRAFT_46994 [Colletotrichum cereale]